MCALFVPSPRQPDPPNVKEHRCHLGGRRRPPYGFAVPGQGGATGGPMGKDVTQVAFSSEDRVRYRQKVRRCLDVFAYMLGDFAFDTSNPMTGLEIELNLMDGDAEPAMRNAEILSNLADPTFQTEL